MKTIFRTCVFVFITFTSLTSVIAQNNLGATCGCPPVAGRPSVNFSTLADNAGNLTAKNTVLSCDKTYVLDNTGPNTTGKYYVGNGKSITIAPGTVIKGMPETVMNTSKNGGVLIISRGGKIFAAGTETCPIVFTASADPMNGTYSVLNKGKWGGVIILGTATNNVTTANALNAAAPYNVNGIARIEGFTTPEPRIYYGAGVTVGGLPDFDFPAFDDNDNSGIMTYVSLRHGGEKIGLDNEINGLTLGSVGRGTTLHHIEVVSNLDDGIEFFGGTVDIKYASVLFNDDDGFDWDHNWTGRGQFLVHMKTDMTTATGGDNGFESDGEDDNINSANVSNPNIYNVTFIGSKNVNGNTAISAGAVHGAAIRAKEATKGTIRNSIFANYGRGLRLDDVGAVTSDALDNWLAGTLKVECNTWVDNTVPLYIAGAPVTSGTNFDKFTMTDGNSIVSSVSGLTPAHSFTIVATVPNGTSIASVSDLIPATNIASTCTAAPVDGFYTPAAYRGAFESGKKSWLSNYTINALLDMENNLIPCLADLTGDGVIDTSDFLNLLGTINSSCD